MKKLKVTSLYYNKRILTFCPTKAMIYSISMNKTLQDLLIDASTAAQHLLAGEVGIIPTDTVYGLVARASNKQAVARLYALKHREHKPGTIIAASVQQLRDLGVPNLDQTENLWPNPLSIILPVSDEFSYLHQEVGDIAMRVTDDASMKSLLEKTGPLLTSSANQPGEPGSINIQQAWNYFGDSMDFYVDGGDRSGRTPSTIIRLLDDGEIEVIREGAIKL